MHGEWLNPAQVSKSCPKEHTHIRNNRKAVVKPADHPVTPTQPRCIALRLTPAVCRERTEQLEAWASVSVCVCQRDHNCELLHECVYLRVHGPVKNAPVLVAHGTASARFNSPLNAIVTPVRLCVATYLPVKKTWKKSVEQ